MSLLVEEEVLEVGVEELEMLLLVLTVSLHYRIWETLATLVRSRTAYIEALSGDWNRDGSDGTEGQHNELRTHIDEIWKKYWWKMKKKKMEQKIEDERDWMGSREAADKHGFKYNWWNNGVDKNAGQWNTT